MRPASSSSAAPPRDAAQLVLEAIREMIYQGRLSPGQQLRQEELAIALGVSRNPVHEALKGLQAERFVGHSLNQGYFVTRFSAAELQQIYLMRQLVETQVLLSLPPFSRSEVQVLVKLNGALGVAAEAPSVSEMIRINREFSGRRSRRSRARPVPKQRNREEVLADVRARPADAEGCTRAVRGRCRSANKEITP
ncbi:MAG: GntR family transcriptional regulator [Candidatus Acidiferrales bacterium]